MFYLDLHNSYVNKLKAVLISQILHFERDPGSDKTIKAKHLISTKKFYSLKNSKGDSDS